MHCCRSLKRTPIFAALVILIGTGFLLAPSDLRGTDESVLDGWRRVELRAQRLSVQLPFHWRLVLNERAGEGASILAAQDVNDSGQLRPASLNIRFSERENGQEYPLPDPEAYADVLLASLRTNQGLENIQLIESSTVERSGLQGTLVEYTFDSQGVAVRGRSLNLIATNPPRRYIFSYGTAAALWEDDMQLLEGIIESIETE